MAIFLEKFGIQYFPTPKNACTSLKTLFYFLDTGRNFEPTYRDGKQVVHIHNWRDDYVTTAFGSEHSRFRKSAKTLAILRDPIARVISCYTNRVRDYKELSESYIDSDVAGKLGVPLNPGLNAFILGMPQYRAMSVNIRHHTELQSYFLGPYIDRFDMVYKIEDLDKLAHDLTEMTGVEIVIPHEQRSGSRVDLEHLSARAKQELIRITAGDYALLRGYYEQPF